MEFENSIVVFNALSNENRIRLFRLLVESSQDGLTQTQLAEKMGNMPRTTLCFHLDLLREADLCSAEKSGKNVIYKPVCGTVRKIAAFLLKDCCKTPECSC